MKPIPIEWLKRQLALGDEMPLAGTGNLDDFIARLNPEAVANELLSVQPMTEVEGDAIRVLTKEPGQA